MPTLSKVGFILCLASAVVSSRGLAGELEYAPAPPDNPLRGLVPYVSASGKAQFPHSLEFRYFAWKDLMTGPGKFDWSAIEQTLDEVGGRGNQLIFRVYSEYPGEERGIPDFLVAAGVKVTTWTNESDGEVSHTPDYGNALLREHLVAFVEAMGAKYDGDPRVGFVTAGLLGSWGEWHTYPRDDLWASKPVQREVMEAFARAFTETKVLLRYPAGPDTYWHAENHERPFGYHDDSFAWATLDTGKEDDSWYFEPAMRDAGASEKWKRFPIGGEIRPELWKQSFTGNRHPREQDFVTCVERLHATWLMDSGLFDVRFPITPERKKTALRETARLGYELHVSEATWADGELTLTVENRGVAPFYQDWPVEIEVDGRVRKTEWRVAGILPGKPRTLSIALPAGTPVKVRVPNPMSGGKALRFANREQGPEWLVIEP